MLALDVSKRSAVERSAKASRSILHLEREALRLARPEPVEGRARSGQASAQRSPRHFPQLESLNLSRRRFWQFRKELNPPRPLVFRQPLAHELLELLRQLRRAGGAVAQHDERHRLGWAALIPLAPHAA